MPPKTKLHLGCGTVILPGYVNMDVRPLPGVDVITDVFTLPDISNFYADEIYASHILEHAGRNRVLDVLKRWNQVLKPDGLLYISVPNFDAIVERYQDTHDLPELLGLLYGRQDYPGNAHLCTWNSYSIWRDLKTAGFICVDYYNWRFTDHAGIDDCSRAHLPHDPEAIRTGEFDDRHRLMSLNMIAHKRNTQ